MQGRYGPNSAVVEAMLDRARTLTEAEGHLLWEAHLHMKAREGLFRAALEAVIHASHAHGRQRTLQAAEAAGREVTQVFANTALGEAIAGYVGRLAEALSVSDVVDSSTLSPLTQPWIDQIGPLELTRPSEIARP